MIRVLCKWFGERHPWTASKEADFTAYLSKSPLVEIVFDESIADIVIVFNKHLTPARRFDLRLLMSTYYHNHRDKILIYDETDLPKFILPGLYVSTHSALMGHHVLPVPYINLVSHAFAGYKRQFRPITCSFWGRDSHNIRSQLYAIHQHGYSINNTSKHDFFNMDLDNQNRLMEQKVEYAETLGSSMYSLCPRGLGTSSIRLYESIFAGCVPVIISDYYVPPSNVDWEKCALFIKESDTAQIVKIITDDIVNYSARKAMIDDSAYHMLQPSAVTDYIIHHRPQSTLRETFLRFFAQILDKTRISKVKRV